MASDAPVVSHGRGGERGQPDSAREAVVDNQKALRTLEQTLPSESTEMCDQHSCLRPPYLSLHQRLTHGTLPDTLTGRSLARVLRAIKAMEHILQAYVSTTLSIIAPLPSPDSQEVLLGLSNL